MRCQSRETPEEATPPLRQDHPCISWTLLHLFYFFDTEAAIAIRLEAITIRNKENEGEDGIYSLLLGAPGIATRSKDATRGSWPYY